MDSKDNEGSGSSRREFLRKVPMGLLGVAALMTVGGGLFGRARQRVGFGPDSIFRPRDGGPSEV